MSCCKLSLKFNFAVRLAEPRCTKLRCHNDLFYARYYHIIDAFVNKHNCSKHDVTMVSGSQVTVRTCNNYNGSNVRSFCWRWGRHDTLLILTHAVSANRILWVYAGFWWYHGILVVHLQDSVGAFGAKWLTKWLHHAKHRHTGACRGENEVTKMCIW